MPHLPIPMVELTEGLIHDPPFVPCIKSGAVYKYLVSFRTLFTVLTSKSRRQTFDASSLKLRAQHKLNLIVIMKAILAVLVTFLAVASAGIHHGYAHHGYHHVPVHHVPVAPVVHVAKVPIATSYQHEHRTYHHVVPVVKHVQVVQPVVKYVQPVHHVPVHHVPVHHGHHYGHGHGHHGLHSVGYGHGFAHYGGHHY